MLLFVVLSIDDRVLYASSDIISVIEFYLMSFFLHDDKLMQLDQSINAGLLLFFLSACLYLNGY